MKPDTTVSLAVGAMLIAALVAAVTPLAAAGSRRGASPSITRRGPLGITVSRSLRVDRHYIRLPPAYRRPPPGFRALPGTRTRRVFPSYVTPRGDRAWVPGRTEVILGRDGAGRVVHVLEYIPGHFVDK